MNSTATTWKTKTMTIEELWASLRRQGTRAQRRVDPTHPLDLYADYQPPDKPGIILFTDTQPPQAPQLRAIGTETGRRPDGKYSLRLQLTEPRLIAVFAELCRDIIECTKTGVDPRNSGGAVLARLDRWQNLLQSQSGRLTPALLRGLIGELLLLETCLIPSLGPDEATAAWTGPLGTSQDFQLPTGDRIEVKAAGPNTGEVRINGLNQLDAGGDRLRLAVVRLEDTGIGAAGALTAKMLIDRLRDGLNNVPVARSRLEQLLGFLGWDDAEDTSNVVVRLHRIDWHDVAGNFPRLTFANVPQGITDASYVLALPPATGGFP